MERYYYRPLYLPQEALGPIQGSCHTTWWYLSKKIQSSYHQPLRNVIL